MFHWRDSENCVVRIQREVQSPGLWQTTRCDCSHPLRDTRVNEGGKKSECVWYRNYWKIQIERQSETRPWAAMKCRALPQLGRASQPGCAGGRILWFQRQSVSCLHSRGGWKASQYPLGQQDAFWSADVRFWWPRHWWLGAWGQLLCQRELPGLGHSWQYRIHCWCLQNGAGLNSGNRVPTPPKWSFVSENSVVAAGHDRCSMLLNDNDHGCWAAGLSCPN